MIEEMLAYNREFVRSKGYEKFHTSKFPDKKSHPHLHGYPSGGVAPRSAGHPQR